MAEVVEVEIRQSCGLTGVPLSLFQYCVRVSRVWHTRQALFWAKLSRECEDRPR